RSIYFGDGKVSDGLPSVLDLLKVRCGRFNLHHFSQPSLWTRGGFLGSRQFFSSLFLFQPQALNLGLPRSFLSGNPIIFFRLICTFKTVQTDKLNLKPCAECPCYFINSFAKSPHWFFHLHPRILRTIQHSLNVTHVANRNFLIVCVIYRRDFR